MLYIHLFGYLRLFDDEFPLPFSARPKTLPLWAYLLLHRAQPVPRDTLAGLLWPDVPGPVARANLSRHLYGLRQALPAAAPARPWLLQQTDTLQWNPAANCWLDVAEFERLSASPDHLLRAIALYTGDLLPQVYDDWILFDRERLRNLHRADLHQLAARSCARGDLPQAITYTQQLLGRDPLQEDTVRELIALRYRAGDRAGALQTYQSFASQLQDDLGSAPMPETTALYEAALHSLPPPSPSLPTAPELAPPRPSPYNVPASLNPFFGREAELRAVHDLFAAEAAPVRLLTLTGPAGVGKTRLALEVTARMLPHHAATFPDGIFFVDLTTVTDPSLVLPAVSATVGVQESGQRPLPEALADWLRPRYVLLLLDNLEQVIAAGPLITGLLEAAPNLRVLATSRTVLQVAGEHEYSLAPLPLPDLERQLTLQDLLSNPAVALFVARAQERQPDFALTEQGATAVAEVCARLDGLPLAIELAARQVKAFSPADILVRLSRRLTFLEGGPRDQPARHQTLRAAIDWSYQLLNEEEKALFAALGVFAGGWTRPAAEAVCGPSCPGDVGKGLAALADQSLLQRSGGGDEPRFGMLQSIREYALELLECQGWHAALAQRHLDYFAGLADQACAEQHGPHQLTWLQWLSAELDNLRAAMAWGLDPAADAARAGAGARLAWALAATLFWRNCGRLSEGRRWCELALRHRHQLDVPRCAELLYRAGWFALFDGDYPAADAACQEGLALARQVDDRDLIATGLSYLGVAAGRQADYERAEALLSEAIAMCREDSGGEVTQQLATQLSNLAIVARHQGEYDRAAALIEEALAFMRAQGIQRGTAGCLANLSNLALEQRDYARAEASARECLQIHQSLDDKTGMAIALTRMADLALFQGQPVRSTRLFGAFRAWQEATGFTPGAGDREEEERHFAALRELLGAADFAAAWAQGASMTLEQAVAYALG